MHCSREEGGLWKGDILVVDVEELEILDASEILALRLNAKEVITQKRGDNIFPNRRLEQQKFFGKDAGVRESSPRRDQLVRSEDLREELQGNSERSQPTDEKKDVAEARNDLWSIEWDVIYRHHVEPRVQLCHVGSSHFLLEIPFVICSQWVRLCFGLCVCLSFSCAGVVLAALALERFLSGMVSDGIQTQRRGSWILGEEGAEQVLASAVSIDGWKEWTCKFCSESNVWTRWRCRRCCHDIPAVLRGKYRQAIAARTQKLGARK